jgi:hypothetical protein
MPDNARAYSFAGAGNCSMTTVFGRATLAA